MYILIMYVFLLRDMVATAPHLLPISLGEIIPYRSPSLSVPDPVQYCTHVVRTKVVIVAAVTCVAIDSGEDGGGPASPNLAGGLSLSAATTAATSSIYSYMHIFTPYSWTAITWPSEKEACWCAWRGAHPSLNNPHMFNVVVAVARVKCGSQSTRS